MRKKVLIGLAVVVVLFVGFVATRPDEYRVERSTIIIAPAEPVFAQLNDLHMWSAWSPWDKLDPDMRKTFRGPPEGVGARYIWHGNSKVGKGQMAIVKSQPPSQITYQLEFLEPFASRADSTFTLAAAPGGTTRVRWSMSGHKNFMAKLFGVFMDMDEMIGSDFETGLAQLKSVVERRER